jgi:hypothetical protein
MCFCGANATSVVSSSGFSLSRVLSHRDKLLHLSIDKHPYLSSHRFDSKEMEYVFRTQCSRSQGCVKNGAARSEGRPTIDLDTSGTLDVQPADLSSSTRRHLVTEKHTEMRFCLCDIFAIPSTS